LNIFGNGEYNMTNKRKKSETKRQIEVNAWRSKRSNMERRVKDYTIPGVDQVIYADEWIHEANRPFMKCLTCNRSPCVCTNKQNSMPSQPIKQRISTPLLEIPLSIPEKIITPELQNIKRKRVYWENGIRYEEDIPMPLFKRVLKRIGIRSHNRQNNKSACVCPSKRRVF